MIVLDTHIWVWWVADDPRLPPSHRMVIAESQATGVGVSAISCWEVAKDGKLLNSPHVDTPAP